MQCLGVAQVEGHNTSSFGLDLQHCRWLPDLRLVAPRPDLSHEPSLLQLHDQRRHGRSGEIGDAGNIGPAERVTTEELLKHEPQIGGTGGVQAGSTVTYDGSCTPGGMRWAITSSATFPNKFNPKQ